MSRALIVYFSKTGHTREAGEAIAGGLRESDVEVEMRSMDQVSAEELAGYDLIVVGSPCWGGSLHVLMSGIPIPVGKWLARFEPHGFEGKPVAAFTVHWSFGGQVTLMNLEQLLTDMGGWLIKPGPVVKAGVPFSLWRGPDASPEDREKLRRFGRDLAHEMAEAEGPAADEAPGGNA